MRGNDWECYPRSPNAGTWAPGHYGLSWLLDTDEEDVAAVDLNGHVVFDLDFLAGPEVLAFDGAAQAQLLSVEMEGMSGLAVAAGVQDGDGGGSARELLLPHSALAFTVDAIGLFAEGILIEGDDVTVGEDRVDFRLHVREVVAGEE